MERTIQHILQQLPANQEKAEANRKADVENLKRMLDEMLRANHDGLQETTACNGATETKPYPEMMQSVEEHQDIHKEDVAVMPVGEPRKRRRVCNLASERSQKKKKRTRGKSGSRRKYAAAGRKVSRRAKLAWRKRNIDGKECTRANVVQEIQRGRTFLRRRQQEPDTAMA
jgi:hypothetical protein